MTHYIIGTNIANSNLSKKNFSEILSEVDISSFNKMHLKKSSAKWQQFFLGFNVWENEPTDNNETGGLPTLPRPYKDVFE